MSDDQQPMRPEPSQAPNANDPATQMLERLLDLAHDASSYLRHHHQAAVRTAAALLLAASLAACSPSSPNALEDEIAPLTEEVRSGLPAGPGRYPIQPQSIRRDSQGIYYFGWQEPGGATWNQASVSLAQLVQDQTDELEIPASGDPILHLREDTPIALADSAGDLATPTAGTPTTQSTGSSGGGFAFIPWFPFYGSTGASSPSYRNPPATSSDSSAVRGSTASASPPTAAARTSGLPHAVSGQARGTGSGTAASGKSGATSGGVSGQSGGSGSGTAASGKSSSSTGSGVGSTSSGGFSSGGSSGGSSSSSSS